MKSQKLLAIIVFILSITSNMWPQTTAGQFLELQTIDYNKIDISRTRIDYVNYKLYYVTGLIYDSEKYNLLLEYDGENQITLLKYYPEKDIISSRSVRPDFRKIQIDSEEKGTVRIENARLFNKTYTIDLALTDEKSLEITGLVYRDIETTRSSPFTNVLTTFENGTAGSGSWKATDTSLVQEDETQMYGKYVIDLDQKLGQYKYTFSAKAEGDGWIGYGLHFDVTGEKSVTGYGLGESYLVWFTRDMNANKNNGTYVELYRSYSDTKMIRVASQLINRDIEDLLNIEINYNIQAHLISVVIDSQLGLSLMPNEKIMDFGSKIAFRTLGAKVEFGNLDISGH